MHLVTNLGDLAVLLPASLGLIVFLAWIDSRRDAAAYTAAALVCLTAALFAKLALAACAGRYSLFGVESPSGHVAFSATFYGCFAVLFGAGRTLARRLALYAGAAALVLLMAPVGSRSKPTRRRRSSSAPRLAPPRSCSSMRSASNQSHWNYLRGRWCECRLSPCFTH
jgi:hypothetical protein